MKTNEIWLTTVDGGKVMVGILTINSVREINGYTRVITNNDTILVKESPEEVEEIISKANQD